MNERRAALALVVLLTLGRSAFFFVKPALAFDSDQAIFGLMAKHIAAGRAFPLFMYGTSYILAVEAWLAAPVFLVAGVSVATLKLPLLLINVAISVLLVELLVRDARLRPRDAAVASLFFVLAPPGTATALLAPIGGNVEPLLYVLLLWLSRRRPVIFGLILGVGFLQREFTIYGAAAVVIIDLLDGHRRAEDWRRWLGALRIAAEVWLVVLVVRPFASAAGPGTTIANLMAAPNNLANLVGRFCFDPRALITGIERLITVHWPVLFGTAVVRLDAFLMESAASQGIAWSGLVLALLFALMAVRIAMQSAEIRTQWPRCRFPLCLTLTGALSAFVYAAGRCGALMVGTMRYDLLSLVGAVGLTALFLVVERTKPVRTAAVALVVVWAAVSVTAHVKLWAETLSHPEVPHKILVIRSLEARGIRYAIADYWMAYYITFMTNERIVVASYEIGRIPVYNDEVLAHAREAVRISRSPCGESRPIIDGVYFCPLDR